MIGLVNIIAGLGWDPEIRGLLTVVLGMAVLAGSVWLLLVTNTGTRLGSLIALAGFWGWMFVMGIFWWIYGIGWVGSLPTWEIENVFSDEPGIEAEGLQDAFVGNVGDLPDLNCFNGVDSFPPAGGVATVSLDSSNSAWSLCSPRAIDVLMAYTGSDRELLIQEVLNPQSDEGKVPAIAVDQFAEVRSFEILTTSSGEIRRVCPGSGAEAGDDDALCLEGRPTSALAFLESRSTGERNAIFDELVARRQAEVATNVIESNERLGGEDFRYRSGAELDLWVQENIDNTFLRIDDITMSQLRALAPQVTDWAQAGAGVLDLDGWNLQSTSEAGEATATADAFLREELFPDGNFVVLDAYQQGGKSKRTGRGLWDRISHKISSTAQITHPTNYTVVTVQQTLEKPLDPSKPPPVPEADPGEPTHSVVMIRNLGNLRLIPALFTVISLLLFLATCLVLHWRDLGLRQKGLEV